MHIHVSTYICIDLCVCVCVFVRACVRASVCVFVCCVCVDVVCVCINVCMHSTNFLNVYLLYLKHTYSQFIKRLLVHMHMLHKLGEHNYITVWYKTFEGQNFCG